MIAIDQKWKLPSKCSKNFSGELFLAQFLHQRPYVYILNHTLHKKVTSGGKEKRFNVTKNVFTSSMNEKVEFEK